MISFVVRTLLNKIIDMIKFEWIRKSSMTLLENNWMILVCVRVTLP
jgi:hypothetical protein